MSKFSYFFWGNPTNKLKLELHVHGRLLIPNHLDQHCDQPTEKLSRRQEQFLTLSLGGAQLCCAFRQPRQVARIWLIS
jgi:hypothetical protein